MSQITFIYIYYINCDRSECLAIFVQTGKEVYESGKYRFEKAVPSEIMYEVQDRPIEQNSVLSVQYFTNETLF